MKMFLGVLLTLAFIGLRRTHNYYGEREHIIFRTYGQRPFTFFPELHLEKYQALGKGFLSSSKIPNSCECGLGNDQFSKKAQSGDVVRPPYKYPWMVAFRKKGEQHVFCGGALISNRFILTAAHCLDRDSEKSIKNKALRVNMWNPREITVAFVTATERLQLGPPIEKLFPHPQFNYRRINHDIGLVKLSRTVPCGKFTNPICLAPFGIPVTVGKVFKIAGWGAEEVHTKASSKYLLEAKIQHMPFSACEKKFHRTLSDNYYCLRGLRGGPCQGDSGGPMFKKSRGKYYALGVASMHSSETCDPRDAFIFTSVSRHLLWIRSIIDRPSQNFYRSSSSVRRWISPSGLMNKRRMNDFWRRRGPKKYCYCKQQRMPFFKTLTLCTRCAH